MPAGRSFLAARRTSSESGWASAKTQRAAGDYIARDGLRTGFPDGFVA
jgi:hypothetical protein